MPDYTIELSQKAKKQLDKLSYLKVYPLLKAIDSLASNPCQPGYKKIIGRDGYCIYSGNYRLIYNIFDTWLVVSIVTIEHGKDIYI